MNENGLLYHINIEQSNNSSHMHIVHMISHGATVLDVGCACGDLGKYLVEHSNCVMYGIEGNAQSVEIARQTKAYIYVEHMDLDDHNAKLCFHATFFDYIVFGDVLEHLRDPQKTVQFFLPFLKHNGCMIISLPNIAHGSIITQLLTNKFEYTDCGLLDRTHIYFFTLESIAKLTASLGLKILTSKKTIISLPGMPPSNLLSALPSSVVAYINANPQAYVWQYVFAASRSDKTETALHSWNRYKLKSFTHEEWNLVAVLRRGFPLWPGEDMSAVDQERPSFKSWCRAHMPRYLWNRLRVGKAVFKTCWLTSLGKLPLPR